MGYLTAFMGLPLFVGFCGAGGEEEAEGLEEGVAR